MQRTAMKVAWRCLALTALVCAWTASCAGAIEVTETVNEEETAAAAPPPANASLPSAAAAAAAAAAADGSSNATAPAPQRITLPSFRPSPRVPSLLRLPGEAPRLSSLQLRQTESKDESSEMGGGADDEGGGGGGGHSGGGFHPAAPPPLDLDVMRKLVKQFKHRGAAGDAHAHPHRHDDDDDDDGHKSLQDYDAVVMAYLKAMKAKHKGGSDGYGGSQGGPALSEPKHKQFGFAPTGGADAGAGGFSGFGGGEYSDFGKGGGETLGAFGDFGKGNGGGFSGFGQGVGGGGGSAGFSDFGKGGGRGNGYGGGSGDKTKSYDNAFPGFGGGSGGSGGFGTTGFGGSGGGKGQAGKGGSLLHTSGHPYPYHVGHDDPVGYRIPSPIYHHEASGYTSKDRGPQDDDGQEHHRGPGGGGKPKGLAGLVKKALHMAAAFIPLGLFLAALPPTVLNINSTASAPGPSPPGGRQRSLEAGTGAASEAEAAARAGAWLEDALLARWGPRALEDAACEARLLCELARAGARPHAPALSAALWALAHDVSQDKISEALQLREVFKAARTDACDIYRCDDAAPPSPPPPPSPSAPPTLGTVAPEVTSDLPHYISESDA